MSEIGYISVKPVINPKNNVFESLSSLKLPNNVSLIDFNKLHCTIIHDERNMELTVNESPDIFPAEVLGVTILGYGIVLLLGSSALSDRFTELTQTYGFKSDFDSYVPHISIAYGKEASEEEMINGRNQVQKLIDTKKLPKMLYFTYETWAKCQ